MGSKVFIMLHSNMYKRSYKLQILSHTQNTGRHQFTNIGSDLRILQVFLSCHRVLLHLLQDLLHHRIRKDALKRVSGQTVFYPTFIPELRDLVQLS